MGVPGRGKKIAGIILAAVAGLFLILGLIANFNVGELEQPYYPPRSSRPYIDTSNSFGREWAAEWEEMEQRQKRATELVRELRAARLRGARILRLIGLGGGVLAGAGAAWLLVSARRSRVAAR